MKDKNYIYDELSFWKGNTNVDSWSNINGKTYDGKS